MSENDLSTLADMVAQLPPERREAIEKELPEVMNPRFDAGVAVGLVRAATIAKEQCAETARKLHEIAVVAAARAVEQRQLYDQGSRLTNTAEARAEIEAEVARIQSGQVKMHSAQDILREMDEILAQTASR